MKLKKLLLLLLFILVGVMFYSYVSDLKYRNQTLEKRIISQSKKLNEIKSIIKKTNSISGTKIFNERVKDVITNKEYYLSDLYSQFIDGSIIIKLANNGCSSCVNKQFKILNKLNKYQNYFVLSYNQDIRSLRILSSKIKHKFNIYHVDSYKKLF